MRVRLTRTPDEDRGHAQGDVQGFERITTEEDYLPPCPALVYLASQPVQNRCQPNMLVLTGCRQHPVERCERP